jgi:hypothetical protein
MIIKLDWFGCQPRAPWETQIHQTLHALSLIKPISRASVRIEEHDEGGMPFHLTLMLTMPGPDVLSHGTGHTFEEALLKLSRAAKKTLTERVLKSRQPTDAAMGVKATHRG